MNGSRTRVICGKVEVKGNSGLVEAPGTSEGRVHQARIIATQQTHLICQPKPNTARVNAKIGFCCRLESMDDGKGQPAIGKSLPQKFIVVGFATAKQPPECISEHGGVSEQEPEVL